MTAPGSYEKEQVTATIVYSSPTGRSGTVAGGVGVVELSQQTVQVRKSAGSARRIRALVHQHAARNS